MCLLEERIGFLEERIGHAFISGRATSALQLKVSIRC